MTRGSLRNPLPGAVAFVFLVTGWLTARDTGETWDEGELLEAIRRAPVAWSQAFHGTIAHFSTAELPAHGLMVDLLGRAFLWAFAADGTFAEELLALHRFHAVLSALAVFLLGRVTVTLTHDARLGALAAAALSVSPQFLAHSQNNPKDLSSLFAFVWALTSLVEFSERRTLRNGAFAALAVGLAAATRVTAVFVLPVFLAWAIWSGTLATPGAKRATAATLLGGAGMTVLLWPWLWQNPIGNLVWAARHVSHFWFDAPVQYLGRTYTSRTTPFHYSIVNLAAFTPLPLLGLALTGAWAGAFRKRAPDLFALAAIWFGVLVGVDLLASGHYDGVRHVLPVLPAIALFAALGADFLLERAGRAGAVGTAAAALWVLGWDASFHPYEGAYVNGVAKMVSGTRVERYFPVEYWGATYTEGSRWLRVHAEPEARVVVPIAPHVAAHQVGRAVEARIPDEIEASGPFYVMYMTRVDSYPPELRELDATYCPVFSVVRDGVTLLAIVSHQSRTRAECGPACACERR